MSNSVGMQINIQQYPEKQKIFIIGMHNSRLFNFTQ